MIILLKWLINLRIKYKAGLATQIVIVRLFILTSSNSILTSSAYVFIRLIGAGHSWRDYIYSLSTLYTTN